ncbi:MAG: ABC transporter permease [Actinomycetota bacterium]|nr:ABC transporter permease [Actinomycetota bacterium]
MAIGTAPAPTAGNPAAPVYAVHHKRRFKRPDFLHLYTLLLMAYLVIPIAVMVLFGFNNTHGRYNLAWQGFTLKWYRNLFAIGQLTGALKVSLYLAVLVMVVTTVMGTLMAYAIHRYKFFGKGFLNVILVMNISSSSVVIGASLLSLFVAWNVALGQFTIFAAQVMFSIPYAVITVRARLAVLDPAIEEAAQDLGARPIVTFFTVTLPQLLPGIMGAAALAFALSIDDFVTTSFVSGTTLTFPLWVYGSTREGTPPQVNVIGTLIFGIGLVVAVLSGIIKERRDKARLRLING